MIRDSRGHRPARSRSVTGEPEEAGERHGAEQQPAVGVGRKRRQHRGEEVQRGNGPEVPQVDRLCCQAEDDGASPGGPPALTEGIEQVQRAPQQHNSHRPIGLGQPPPDGAGAESIYRPLIITNSGTANRVAPLTAQGSSSQSSPDSRRADTWSSTTAKDAVRRRISVSVWCSFMGTASLSLCGPKK